MLAALGTNRKICAQFQAVNNTESSRAIDLERLSFTLPKLYYEIVDGFDSLKLSSTLT